MNGKVVIFDVGNVLYGWDPHSFLERQVPENEARLRFIAETDLFAWHETLDGGRSFAEAADELSGRFPAYAHLIRAWGDRFGETIKDAIAGSHEIVRELHERGTPLFAITNFSADFWKPFMDREKQFFSLFRDIVVSGEVGMLKPDPAIYQYAMRRFGVHPSEAIFIDDRAINVEAAEALGMGGHLFTDPASLHARLEADSLL